MRTTNDCELCSGTRWKPASNGVGVVRCNCLAEAREQKAKADALARGYDELNLCSVALFDFSRGRKGETSVIVREWFRPDGSICGVTAEGSATAGLPTAKDQDLLVILEQITKEEGCPEKVMFRPSELLKRLGWKRNHGYRDLRSGFHRLASLLITQWSGWYDKGARKTSTIGGFHIIDSYFWATKNDIENGMDSEPWFSWGRPILDSMRAGAWKPLDLAVYKKLKAPTAKAAYRYVDRCLYQRNEHKERTEHFYQNILGLSWKTNSPSMMAKSLKKHLREFSEVAKIEVRISNDIVEFKRI